MAKKQEQPQAEIKHQETPVEFLSSLAAVLVTGLFIITFVLQTFVIPSSSMEDTLLIGDHVFVNRVQFAPPTPWIGRLLPYREIRHNDIVVFLSPMTQGLFVVKRIMGVPGDHIHLRDGVVYRNGQKLEEKYVRYKGDPNDPQCLRCSYRMNFPAVAPTANDQLADYWEDSLQKYVQGEDLVVPADSYFGMGDNRDMSYDSRYWGFIPKKNVIGRPMFIYWSFTTPPHQYEMQDWDQRLGFLAHTVLHFFDETRWSRTLNVVR